MDNPSAQVVNLLGIAELLDRHLTEALCEESWDVVRRDERRRLWTLALLVRFWTSVTLNPPPSLRHALSESVGGVPVRYPRPDASEQAFFARCQDLRWEFFRDVHERFAKSLLAEAPRTYCRELKPVFERFHAVEAVDGSDLDAVARRLKALRKDGAVPLPGAILAFLDLSRGTLARLIFDPRVETAEFNRAVWALDGIPKGTLLVGDRLYGVQKFFAGLTERGLFGVARRFSVVTVRRERLLSRRTVGNRTLEDWEVLAGTGQTVEPQRLRLIRLRQGKRVRLELLTNVPDPARLSAEEALTLYRHRWDVERLFSDLKCVVKLNRFYAANTNAVGMQVYSAAIVHTALRVAQAKAAQEADLEPEEISPAKFFPKAAAASSAYTNVEWGFEATREANPGVRLKKPDWREAPFASTSLASVRVEHRKPKPKGQRKARSPYGTWRSLPPPRKRNSPPSLS